MESLVVLQGTIEMLSRPGLGRSCGIQGFWIFESFQILHAGTFRLKIFCFCDAVSRCAAGGPGAGPPAAGLLGLRCQLRTHHEKLVMTAR